MLGYLFCGDAVIEGKTIADYIRIFEINQINEQDNVITVTNKLLEYASELLINNKIEFLVSGYYEDNPYVYLICKEGCTLRNYGKDGVEYGVSWRGEIEAISKLSVSEIGKFVQENIYDVGLNYIAYLESQMKIRSSLQLFEKISTKSFAMWNPSATMELFKGREEGYIQIYRVYELEDAVPYFTVSNGSKGKNSLFKIRDKEGNIGYKVKIGRRVKIL
ncbi:MAG TPA: hypothetical protein VIK72_00315 [Clostridiaceae bacterium]